MNRNLPGTRGSEPVVQNLPRNPRNFPEPVVRNLSFRTCPGTPRNFRNPWFGTCRSEPAPEPPGTSWNPWFGTWFGTCPETCPGTFPEPVIRNLPRNRPGAYIGKDPIAKAVGEYTVFCVCVCSVSVSVVSLMPGYILYTAPPPSFTLCLRLYHLFSHFTCQLAHATASSVEFSSLRLRIQESCITIHDF